MSIQWSPDFPGVQDEQVDLENWGYTLYRLGYSVMVLPTPPHPPSPCISSQSCPSLHLCLPHLLQGVAGQLAAWAKDRPMVLGCELLQLSPELLLLFWDHAERAHLGRKGLGRSENPSLSPTSIREHSQWLAQCT